MMTTGCGPSGSGVVPFDPLNLAVGEWFDIRTLAGTADSDPVGAWAGNKGVYTLAASATARPTYAVDEGDGSPALLFDGGDDAVSVGITNSVLHGTAGDLEIWLSIRMPLVPAGGIFYCTGGSNQIGLNGGATTGTLSLCHGSVNVTFPTTAMADNAWHVIRLMKSGARRLMWIDGAPVYDASTSAGPYTTGADVLYLGNYFGTAGQVRFRHFLTVTEPLDDETAGLLNNYLGAAK